MKVLNLFGGPGSGKSTLAACLFCEMKKAGHRVELVTEYAKDMVWEDRTNVLDDQLYILAKQNRRLLRLENKVDFAITDSPLLLGLIYMDPAYYPSFHALVCDVWHSYDNLSFFLQRSHGYKTDGRLQNYDQAKVIDDQILMFLNGHLIPYEKVQPSVQPVDLEYIIVQARKAAA